MSNSAELANYEWLVGPEAEPVLCDLAAGREPLHTLAARLRRHFSPARAHLLLEQIELRERATVKFSQAHQMFFTRLGLEQASDEWVARYKAQRFASRGPLADICCGIGGDLLALAEQGEAIGVDRGPISTCLAAANIRTVLSPNTAKNATLETSDANQYGTGGLAAWHIDPDRRPTGKRTSSLKWSSPSLASVERLLANNCDAAVKLAPAADVPELWLRNCEFEWISRGRQCRQLVAWHGGLARTPGQRRATVLAADGIVRRTLAGSDTTRAPIAKQLDRFLFEPDPAVLAAHLTGALAAEHQLLAISAGIDYLTGTTPIVDPAVSCFEVEEILPLKMSLVAESLHHRNIGQLEIKKRGVDHDPQSFRKQLKLAGNESATLFLTKLNGKHAAILAHRVTSSHTPTPECLSLTPVS